MIFAVALLALLAFAVWPVVFAHTYVDLKRERAIRKLREIECMRQRWALDALESRFRKLRYK